MSMDYNFYDGDENLRDSRRINDGFAAALKIFIVILWIIIIFFL